MRPIGTLAKTHPGSFSLLIWPFLLTPKDHWTLKTGFFEDPTPAVQVQTLPLEGPRSLGTQDFSRIRVSTSTTKG